MKRLESSNKQIYMFQVANPVIFIFSEMCTTAHFATYVVLEKDLA